MRRTLLAFALCSLALTGAVAHAADPDAEGFVPMFNGKDLSGWVPVNVAPGTFTMKDGVIHSTGVPTGVMRTERQYENFVVEMEWMHLKPKGNAGLFLWGAPMTAPGTPFARGIEVQILDDAYVSDEARAKRSYTGHGDIFPIHGATMKPDRPHPNGSDRCLPSEKRAKPAGQWNHYRVEAIDGVVKLAVNGKVVSGGSNCRPRKGYLCLESEGSPAMFRNVRIKELPSTNPKPEETAPLAQDFKSLYTGVDLSGWRQDPGHEGHWVARDWTLDYDGKSEAADKSLWTEKEYGDFELIVDWRFTREPKTIARPVILPSGDAAKHADGTERTQEVADAGDSGIYLRGSSKSQVNLWNWPVGSGEVWGYRTDPAQPADVRAACTPRVRADRKPGEWNRTVITMRGDRLTVVLNEQTVIDNARLPGVPARGPVALQHHGDPIQFANLFVRELEPEPAK